MYTLRSLRYNRNHHSVNSTPAFYTPLHVWFTVNSQRHIWVKCRSSTAVVRITPVHHVSVQLIISVRGMSSEKRYVLGHGVVQAPHCLLVGHRRKKKTTTTGKHLKLKQQQEQ